MEGFGPTEGSPKRTGVVVASKDPVAADIVGAKIIRVKPSSIKYLNYAAKKGIGNMDKIEVVGDDLSEINTQFSFISEKLYILGSISLWFQRYARYNANFAKLLSLARSSLSTIGLSTMQKSFSYKEITRLAKETVFRLEA
jgi:hypothetical protein